MIDQFRLPMRYHQSERMNYCSEASSKMIFDFFGIPITQDEIHNNAWTIEEMMPLFSRYGLQVQDFNVHTPVFLYRIPTLIFNGQTPVLIRYRYGGVNSGGHTVVCYGFTNNNTQNDLKLLILDPDTGPEEWVVNEVQENITNVYTFKNTYPGEKMNYLDELGLKQLVYGEITDNILLKKYSEKRIRDSTVLIVADVGGTERENIVETFDYDEDSLRELAIEQLDLTHLHDVKNGEFISLLNGNPIAEFESRGDDLYVELTRGMYIDETEPDFALSAARTVRKKRERGKSRRHKVFSKIKEKKRDFKMRY